MLVGVLFLSFLSRARLVADALNARRAACQLEEQEAYLRNLRNTARYNVPGEQRLRIDAAFATAEKQSADARLRAEEAQNKLNELDFWPVRRRLVDARLAADVKPELDGQGQTQGSTSSSTTGGLDLGRDWEEDFQHMKQNVSDLHDAVRRLDQQLREVATFVSARSRPPPAVIYAQQLLTEPGASVMESVPGREPKRRRTGVEGSFDTGADGDGGGPAFDPLDAMSASRLLRRVDQLEAQCAEIENLHVQEERASSDEIAAQIETVLDGMRERGELAPVGVGGARGGLGAGASGKGKSKEEREVEVEEKEAKLRVLQQTYEQVGADVDELATTITSVITMTTELRERQEAQEAEREAIARERAEVCTSFCFSSSRLEVISHLCSS